jgi:predicted transcriptional regulator
LRANLEKAGLLRIATISRKKKKEYLIFRAQRVLRIFGRKLFLYTGMMPAEDSAVEEWLSTFEESALTVRALERRWWRTDAPATFYREGWVYGDVECSIK